MYRKKSTSKAFTGKDEEVFADKLIKEEGIGQDRFLLFFS